MSQPLGRIAIATKLADARTRLAENRAHREVASTVLEFQSPTASLVALPAPASARNTVWVVASLVLVCALAMALIPVDKVVSAHGRVVSVTPTLVIQPLDTSIVRAIEVREGQTVHAGETLARLDPTFASADLGDARAQSASIGAEVARLQAEIADLPYQPAATDPATTQQLVIYQQRQAARRAMLDSYAQKIDSLKSTAQRSAADVRGYRARLGIAANVESKRAELERLQVGSQLNRLQATDNRMEIERSLADSQNAVQGAIRDLQAQVAQRNNYLEQWRADTSQTLTEQQRKLSDARQALAKADLRQRLVNIVADRDAVVLTVAKVSVGSVLQSGDQFITMVPLGAPLEVETSVAGDDAGYVGVGDPVTVKFDTFPYVHYGTAKGTVRTISSDSFSVDQAQNQTGARRDQATAAGNLNNGVYFRTRIQLDQIGLHDTPRGFRVTPGMPVTADIKVGKRTVLSYLFSRMLPVATEGMREP